MDGRHEGHPVSHQQPVFMLGNLEAVKMSLIGAATQNAHLRAIEFAKNGDATVGPMRSASQGAFYILPVNESVEVDEYGGRYDKSTIDKLARVAVMIDYSIENWLHARKQCSATQRSASQRSTTQRSTSQ
jgi:hypothetical protein